MTILAAELPDVGFVRVEAESVADVSMEHEVAAVPTFVFFRQNKVLDRIEGAKAAETTKRIRELAKQDGPSATPKPPVPLELPKEPLEQRFAIVKHFLDHVARPHDSSLTFLSD